MLKTLATSIRVTVVTLVLTGLAYPLLLTAAARGLFPKQASGSLIVQAGGRLVGSEWIGQSFQDAAYFQARPSAAGSGYDATASSGANLGPTSAKLRDRIVAAVGRLRGENPDASGPIPVELVTASASGLDPHLSPSATLWQVPRVARARGVDENRVRALVEAAVEDRQFGLLGEPRVNVLRLNLALDHAARRAHGGS